MSTATAVAPLTNQDAEALQLNAQTADVVDAVQPGGPFRTLPTALDRLLLFIAGGVPVRRGGRLIGAIGVGDGAPDRDHVFVSRPRQSRPSTATEDFGLSSGSDG